MAIIDAIVSMLRQIEIEPRLTYNRSHIALNTVGYNFCWFHPRKLGNCHIECRVSEETRDAAVSNLQSSGIDASPLRNDFITFGITVQTLKLHQAVLVDVLKRAEEWSKR